MADQAAVNVLTTSLGDLVGESRALRGDLHAAEEARRRAAVYNLGLLGLVVALVVAALVIGWQNNQLGQQVARTNEQVADCTTAGGQCYEQSNARTGKAIQDLIRSQVLVAECARLYPGESGPTYDAKIETCVAQRLTRATPSTTPAPAPSHS